MERIIKFLRNPCTLLAGVSVVLPVFNLSVRFLPLAPWSQGGSLAYLSPQVVTLAATVGCLFVFVRTVSQSEPQQRVEGRNASYPRVAWSLLGAAIGLGLYLLGHYEIKHDFYYRVLGWDSEEAHRLVGDLALSICYGLCFASITRTCFFLRRRNFASGVLDGSD